MLISATLPQTAAPQSTNVAATQSAFLAAATASASRPLTPTAVNAAAAASPYSPQLLPQRRAVAEQPSNTQGRPAILPDPEFWRVPDRQQMERMPPQPVRTSAETVQQTTAYVAQVVAQQVPEFKQPEAPQPATPAARRQAALIGKQPGVGDTSGFSAYNVASQRNVGISLPSTVEAFA